MVELADTLDSGSSGRKAVGVQVPPFAPIKKAPTPVGAFLCLKSICRRNEQAGVGNLSVKQKNERIGRNPKTGAEITISARGVLTFKPIQALTKQLNG